MQIYLCHFLHGGANLLDHAADSIVLRALYKGIYIFINITQQTESSPIFRKWYMLQHLSIQLMLNIIVINRFDKIPVLFYIAKQYTPMILFNSQKYVVNQQAIPVLSKGLGNEQCLWAEMPLLSRLYIRSTLHTLSSCGFSEA